MNKKEDKKHHQELMIIVIGISIIVPIFSVLFVYMFFSLLLQESSFVTVFSDNLDIIMIVTFALYVLSFTFITKAFLFSKPKKTDTLGKQSWKTVDEQGKRIAEQTEQIEKLNEADNVLKLNAELKKQNEKLKQDKLNAEQEAEATVSSVKREYEAKGRELDRRIGEAAKQSASLKSERQSISEDIEQRATAKYLDQKKELDRKFKAQTASYDSFLLGLLLYGVLTTVFTAVRSEAFVSDFKTFFMVIWQFIVNAFQLLLKGGQWASQLGDKIPQPVVATIVHYLLLIVFVGGIAIGVGFLIFLGASKVFEFYTEDYADTMSLAVFLISLAVSVYFAEPIRVVIPINLLLLLILVHIVYVLIRWYVKGCMRSRGYY